MTFPNPEEMQEVVIFVETDSASCAGEDNDHPRVWMAVPSNGFVQCGYCGIKFKRR